MLRETLVRDRLWLASKEPVWEREQLSLALSGLSGEFLD